MKLDRFRAPALAATAVLLISGGASVFAASPAVITPAPAAAVTQVELAGPETDTLQVGDQTAPDAVNAAPAAAATTVNVVTTPASETTAATPAGTEPAGNEADGPGGHQDATGQNVDHQFHGQG